MGFTQDIYMIIKKGFYIITNKGTTEEDLLDVQNDMLNSLSEA